MSDAFTSDTYDALCKEAEDYLSQGLAEQARELLLKAISLIGTRPRARSLLADCCMSLGLWSEARAQLETLTTLEVGNSSHHFRLGQVMEEMGEYGLARDNYKVVLDCEPGHHGAQVAINRLKDRPDREPAADEGDEAGEKPAREGSDIQMYPDDETEDGVFASASEDEVEKLLRDIGVAPSEASGEDGADVSELLSSMGIDLEDSKKKKEKKQPVQDISSILGGGETGEGAEPSGGTGEEEAGQAEKSGEGPSLDAIFGGGVEKAEEPPEEQGAEAEETPPASEEAGEGPSLDAIFGGGAGRPAGEPEEEEAEEPEPQAEPEEAAGHTAEESGEEPAETPSLDAIFGGGTKAEQPKQEEAEPEPEAKTEPETEAEAEPEPEAEAEPEPEAKTEPETEAKTEPETEAETGPEPEAETGPETEAETGPETEEEGASAASLETIFGGGEGEPAPERGEEDSAASLESIFGGAGEEEEAEAPSEPEAAEKEEVSEEPSLASIFGEAGEGAEPEPESGEEPPAEPEEAAEPEPETAEETAAGPGEEEAEAPEEPSEEKGGPSLAAIFGADFARTSKKQAEGEPEAGAEAEEEPVAEEKPEPEAETEPETEEEPEAGAEAEEEPVAEEKPEPEAETEPETEAGAEPETEAETEPEAEAEAEPEAEAEAEPEAEAEAGPEAEAGTEPEAEAETEPETEAAEAEGKAAAVICHRPSPEGIPVVYLEGAGVQAASRFLLAADSSLDIALDGEIALAEGSGRIWIGEEGAVPVTLSASSGPRVRPERLALFQTGVEVGDADESGLAAVEGEGVLVVLARGRFRWLSCSGEGLGLRVSSDALVAVEGDVVLEKGSAPAEDFLLASGEGRVLISG